MLDIFNSSAFNVIELTEAINVIPNNYGRVGQLGLFVPKGVRTTTVALEINNGVLNLLDTQQRGVPAPVNRGAKRKVKTFTIPHIPLEDRILASDLQGIRAFGTGGLLKEVMREVAGKLGDMKAKQRITMEHLRMTALQGIILDGDGSTEILDLFTDFGVTQKEVDFALDTDGTDVPAKCKEVSRHIEDKLLGDTMTGVRCLCGPDFFDALVSHPTVVTAYQFQQGLNPLRDDLRKGFEFQGIVFEEYRANATASDGTTNVQFIADNEAHFFPVGTNSTFRQFNAPASFIETVNTMGQELYAKQAVDQKFQRWVDLYVESNPLPICMRPEVLVKGTA
ncbi:MAG: major capsid protein [Thermodesulfobacteriota bacterium]